MPDLVVMGAGIAGLATALFAARAGVRVVLVEADHHPRPAQSDASLTEWLRPGVPQLGQGHNFHGLGRRVLRSKAPDVLDTLLELGAQEREFGSRIPPHLRQPGDDELTALQVRRSVFEWALRRAAERQGGLTLRLGVRVVGLIAGSHGSGVAGVTLDRGERIEARWAVDTTGRTSALPRWLEACGIGPVPERQQESNTLYYARHLRLRPGVDEPEGDWLFGPTGDFGYLRFSLLPEDAGHFVITVNTPTSDRDLRILRHADCWQAAVSTFAPLRDWLRPGTFDPASPVFTMGGLRNTIRDFTGLEPDVIAGLVPIGDALCHTNPTQGWGVSLALHHAQVTTEGITTPGDRGKHTAAMLRQLTEHAEPYFQVAAGEDAERARIAAGSPPSWDRPDNALFCRKIAYPQAGRDPVLYRAVQRRIHLLDHPDQLTGDPHLLALAADLHRRHPAEPDARAPSGPARDELVATLAALRR